MVKKTEGSNNSNNSDKSSGNMSLATLKKKFDKTAEIYSTTLYDEDDVKISLNDFEIDNDGVELSFAFTNDTDETLEFVSNSSGYAVNSVNGYMISSGYMNVEVEAGQTESETMTIDLAELITNGISKIADINVGFSISASDYDSNFETIYTGAIKLESSLADSYDYSENLYQKFMKNGFEKALNSKILYYSDNQLLENDNIEVNSFAIVEANDKLAAMVEIKNVSGYEIQCWSDKIFLNDESLTEEFGWYNTINDENTLIGVIDISLYLDNYKGSSELNKIKFTIGTGESSYETETSDEIEVDLSKEKINLK